MLQASKTSAEKNNINKKKHMEKHDLHAEFPHLDRKIHDMKTGDAHFRKLFDQYHHVNKDIHRIETSGVYDDVELKDLRTKRVRLKDQLYAMLTKN